jgi:hypothetical protein
VEAPDLGGFDGMARDDRRRSAPMIAFTSGVM